MTARVLICNDEADLREMLADYLGRRGFRTAPAENAADLRREVGRSPPDVIALDITMPGRDGLSALRGLRAEARRIPVVMLTARGEVADKIVGLEMGADDDLAKPVDLRELEVRPKAELRRTAAEPDAPTAEPDQRWRFGKCWLDIPTATLTDSEGAEVPLTTMEFNLLMLFAQDRGRVLNRDQILEGTQDRSRDPFGRSIDIRISRIRRKIVENPSEAAVIRTVRGIGHVYDPR